MPSVFMNRSSWCMTWRATSSTRSLISSGRTGWRPRSRIRDSTWLAAPSSDGSTAAMSARAGAGSSWRHHTPSECSTPSAPARESSMALWGLTTPSEGAATIGESNRRASICQEVSTSSGVLVRRLGWIDRSASR